jgi:phosphoglycolate phosphatase
VSAIELVVFDWDGTLVDSTAAITESMIGAARDMGLEPPSRKQARQVIGLSLEHALQRVVPALGEQDLPQFIEHYRRHYKSRDGEVRPFDGIEALLQALAGERPWLAVATGKSRVGLNRALEQTGWARTFVTTRCADEGMPKPHPWMLQDICAELGVEPERTVMIGDTIHDLGMAQQAGARAVAVTYGAHDAEELHGWGAELVAHSVEEVRNWLMPQVQPSSRK